MKLLIMMMIAVAVTVGCSTTKPCVSMYTANNAHNAFQLHDFNQTKLILQTAPSYIAHSWVNPHSCHQFFITAQQVHEDDTKPILYQTCRRFTYTVTKYGKVIGSDQSMACRNFATHDWQIY